MKLYTNCKIIAIMKKCKEERKRQLKSQHTEKTAIGILGLDFSVSLYTHAHIPFYREMTLPFILCLVEPCEGPGTWKCSLSLCCLIHCTWTWESLPVLTLSSVQCSHSLCEFSPPDLEEIPFNL